MSAAISPAPQPTEPASNPYPHLAEEKLKASKAEGEVNQRIADIRQEYQDRVEQITAADLKIHQDELPSIPRDFESAWFAGIQKGLWPREERLAVPIDDAYARALMNSNQVKVFSYIPLIRETGIREAKGAYDVEFFLDGQARHSDEPTSSTLTTGRTGRLLEDKGTAETGFRKRLSTGAEVALSNRFTTLDNNSEFLDPNPQTTSQVVLSVAQPLLRGAGYHYNKATLKIAQLDANMAASEYIRQLESHLLEVNRAYWGVYLARAGFLLRKSLADQTAEIVDTIEKRSDEATASELLRARSELSRRRTSLTRSEMAVRNAEERLRALINDPEFPIGGGGEFIPMTRPILSAPTESVKSAAQDAIAHRPEIAQGVNQLKSAAIREDIGRQELLPQLDLIAETGYSGLDSGRRVSGAYDDMTDHGAGWMAGFQFSQPWEQNYAKARQQRRQYELLQQENSLRSAIDGVLLESVVTYRELMTSYRDMQGRYQEVLSTREEVRGLRERLDVDTDNVQTVAYRLQLIMDAIERNQLAEEQFLVAVVSYNIAFAALDRAKGTLLNTEEVSIDRESDASQGKGIEALKASTPSSPAAPDSPENSGK